MKVCTDACLFGAWIAEYVVINKLPVQNCLDIGTGTGLLSLVFAQKNNNSIIDAVEIEEYAYQQATENFTNSKWGKRLQSFHTDIKQWVPNQKYDLIISNPPFYENELLSGQKNKNIAKHNDGLTLHELIRLTKIHLSKSGYFAVLLPYHRIDYFEQLAKENTFYLKEKLLIRQTALHDFFRGILFFSNNKTILKINELTIKNQQGNYTDDFIALLRDYYLYL